MIRDNNKIYGEMNDPNTVLATSTLEDMKPVVGAGNKGVKTIDLGAKKILYVDTSGELKGFAYGTANKIVATDASGNLVLKDIPTGKNVTDILVTGATVSGSGVTTNVFNQPYSDISTAETARSLLEGAGNMSVVKVVKSVDSYTYPTITLTLKNSLVLSTTKNVQIILTVEGDSNNGDTNVWIVGPVKLNSVQLMKQYLGGAVNFPGQNSFINTTISLSAGTYNQIVLESCQVAKGTGYIRVGGCFIV